MTLSGLIARQKNDQARAPLSPKTNLKREAQERLFVDVFGANTPVSSLDRDKARELVEILVRLPPNWTKRFPQMSARDVAKLDDAKLGKPMSATTANSYLSAFSGLLEFGVKEHVLSRNPAADLRIAKVEPASKKKRLPFSSGDLTRFSMRLCSRAVLTMSAVMQSTALIARAGDASGFL